MFCDELEMAADRIEVKSDREFWMGDWFTGISPKHPCGTACCIGGDVCLAHGWVPLSWKVRFVVVKDGVEALVSMKAQELLGLTDAQSEFLFCAGYWPTDVDGLPKRQAAVMLLRDIARGARKIVNGEWRKV